MMQALNKDKKSQNEIADQRRTLSSADNVVSYSTPFFRPATQVNPNNAWLRRMTRIVRHLRDDLSRMHPQENMPTTWMIRCLLASLTFNESASVDINQYTLTDEQWDKTLVRFMQKLADYSTSPKHIRSAFYELDGFTPLFPNQELFSPKHAHRFAELSLSYLETTISEAI